MWKGSHVARRVRFLQELEKTNVVHMMHVPGKANPADSLTKYLTKLVYREYMARIYNMPVTALA